MSDSFKVDAQAAIATSWSDSLGSALLQHHPQSLELVGDWSDLSVFAGAVDSIRNLRLSGAETDGRIRSLKGLECFVGLESLSLANRVETALDALAAVSIKALQATAQPGLLDCLTSTGIRRLTLSSAESEFFKGAGSPPRLAELSLIRPKFADLRCLAGFETLNVLKLSHAPQLVSLKGLEALTRITQLAVETAARLADLGALDLASHLESLRLVGVAKGAAHPNLGALGALEILHLGGKEFGAVDWSALLSLPRLKKAFAPWDPAVIERSAMEQRLSPTRRFRTFDPAGTRGLRMLFVEIE
jgi:hypothetical protein